MMMTRLAITAMLAASLGAAAQQGQPRPVARHHANIKQLTSGGENAEAYFSADGAQLIFQSNPGGTAPTACDQMFTMNVDGSNRRQISKGGRTTCGYFYPDGKSILYASTHLVSMACPPRPSYEKGYVWPVYASYDIFRARPDGS